MRELQLTGALKLAALRQGDGHDRRVLALHGWLDNAMSFAPLAAELRDVDLVALDFPGHGLSQHRPPGTWYHFVDWLDALVDALDALGWQRCTLLGHSLGGAVATAFAAALPERVERLLLIEALGPLGATPGKAAQALRQGLGERHALRGKSLRVFRDPAEAVAARMQANGLGEAAARLLVERGLAPVEGGFVWRSDPRLTVASPLRIHEQQIREWIAAIECPTLVIGADPAPAWFGEHPLRERLAQLRNGTVQVLPGSHHLHMESPHEVALAIRTFLATPTNGDRANSAG